MQHNSSRQYHCVIPFCLLFHLLKFAYSFVHCTATEDRKMIISWNLVISLFTFSDHLPSRIRPSSHLRFRRLSHRSNRSHTPVVSNHSHLALSAEATKWVISSRHVKGNTSPTTQTSLLLRSCLQSVGNTESDQRLLWRLLKLWCYPIGGRGRIKEAGQWNMWELHIAYDRFHAVLSADGKSAL